MKTITRADVAEAIYEEIGLSRKDSNDILDMVIDEIIQENAIGWKINRISHVALAITRLAIYEMLYSHDISHAVAINEAVEIAKLYEGKDAASFINGILGSVSKKNPKTDIETVMEKKRDSSVRGEMEK